MSYSYSRVDCYESCPAKYKFRYLDRVETDPPDDPQSPLILGSAVHLGIEKGIEEAVAWYHEQFPVSDDRHIAEEIKMRDLIAKARAIMPPGAVYEMDISQGDFVGFIDALTKNEDGGYTLWDFKYCHGNPNTLLRYKESKQLHVYHHFLTQLDFIVTQMQYLLIPKTGIRQKKDETVMIFRKRLEEKHLAHMTPAIMPVEFDPQKVERFFELVEKMNAAYTFEKHESPLCDWCEYQAMCMTDKEKK
jgi:hypothetical protein